jgi:hypothetical protein
MTQPTSLDLDAIEARAAAATPGPWKIENDYCDCSDYGCSHPPFAVAFGPFTSFENTSDRHHADAEFASHARTDVPALVAEIRRLRARKLTDSEYNAAWHAVEGAAGEEGADPGTILHAVLDRLGIDWQDAATPAACR